MKRFLIVALLSGAYCTIEANAAHAQYRGAARTGHVAVGPRGGISTGQTRTTARAGPLGSSATQVRTGTKVTPGGATVQYGGASAARSTPFGGSAASAKGVKVTTPSGQTYAHTSKNRVAAGPGGVAATSSSRTATAGPLGVGGTRTVAGAAFR